MTSQVTQKIEIAAIVAGVSDRLSALAPAESARVNRRIFEHFVGGQDRAWWWEALRHPHDHAVLRSSHGFQVIHSVVPDPREPIWFIAEDDQLPHYPVYDTTPEAISAALHHTFAFEYYLVGKSLDWLVCVNHHGVVYGVGERVRARIRALHD